MCENMVKVLKPIIENYGEDAQKLKTVEELSELSKALCKNIYGADNIVDITEEMADVTIMLNQLKIMFGNEEDIQKVIASKIERTYQRIESLKELRNKKS